MAFHRKNDAAFFQILRSRRTDSERVILGIDDQNPHAIQSKTKASRRFRTASLRRDNFVSPALTKLSRQNEGVPTAGSDGPDYAEIS
jgi:hypothetical protein